jgi:Tfp pilus assembly protein PilV
MHLDLLKENSLSRKRGVTVVEAVMGITILATVLLFTSNAIGQFVAFGRTQVDRTKALFIAEEMMEATRFVRDASWTTFANLNPGTTYYIAFGTSTLSVTTTPQTIGGLVPRFSVAQVYRANVSSDIVASTSGVSKSVDQNTRLVEVNVSYGASQPITLYQYLANIAP